VHDPIEIPDKPAFKAGEVCELLKVPPYVLKSWENEFRDLGVSKTPTGPRVYRREDVVRAMRIRHLVLSEGLTLAGVRRRLEEESGAPSPEDALLAEIVAAAPGTRAATMTPTTVAPAPQGPPAQWREQLARVKDGLRELLDALSQPLAVAGGASQGEPGPPPPAPSRRRAAGPGPRRSVAPAPESAAPVRELVVEPEPVEPSLFGDADGDVREGGARPAGAAARVPARTVPGRRGPGPDLGAD
jgi:DNA-binding transcriptional MerR regulator